MKTITYRIAGRSAALEADRLYRRVIDGRLAVRIDNGALRDASPEEIAAARAQLGDMKAAPAAPPAKLDFASMSKMEIEAWARNNHGVELDRRRRKEALIEEARALEAG